MLGQSCILEIDGEKYEIKVNIGTMIDAEQQTGKPFMELVEAIEQGSFLEIVQILSCCLLKDGEPVGYDFVTNLEFDVFQDLFSPLIDSIVAAFPKDDKKKRIKILKMTK